MSVYVDSSALLKRYVDEPDSERAEAILLADVDWVTARHSYVEIALALHRRLADDTRRAAMAAFEADWDRMFLVALDETVCRRAAELGAESGARTLDALHLAAAERAGGRSPAVGLSTVTEIGAFLQAAASARASRPPNTRRRRRAHRAATRTVDSAATDIGAARDGDRSRPRPR